MLKKRLIAFVLCLFVFSFDAYALNNTPDVSAQAAALMVVDTGELLYAKNASKQLPMASTTKIMTSLLALEAGTPERVITVKEDMVNVEGTSMGLLPGDSVTIRTLVYGMLLQSGNDAAKTTAIAISGSTDKFAELMNLRAKEIGMKNTHFVTPSGLDDKEHYTTAYDMALLGCEAIKNLEFRNICSQTTARLSYGNPPYSRSLTNHNRLLRIYDGAIGIKTGFTKKSRRCLVSAAERNGVKLVAVTLNAPSDWNDHEKLLDYGFSLISDIPLDGNLSDLHLKVIGGVSKDTGVKCSSVPKAVMSNDNQKVTRQIYLKKFEYAPINTGAVVGKARYYMNNKLICEVPIVTAGKVECMKYTGPVKKEIKNNFFSKIKNKISEWFNMN